MNNCSFKVIDKYKIHNDKSEVFILSANLLDNADINAFCVFVKESKELSKHWKSISDEINYDYLHNYKPSEFERWNNYLVYVCGEDIETSLKYEIENDKFYMRKIAISASEIQCNTVQDYVIGILNKKLLLTSVTQRKRDVDNIEWKSSLNDYSISIESSNITTGRDAKSIKMRNQWIDQMLDEQK
ncbi:ABC-three component system middle component 1 [Vibrio harveyi]|uniref:ABC-three component system middle component 1 n=1 Tax=Vibrio harveyi TaxID=669 RepID=UPI00037525D5|nr:ABC-three component system middle component 1 [Vibrio harveyi]GEA21724.1 hypothetical protein VH1807_contig00015-0461 [Vibrio harveyi]